MKQIVERILLQWHSLKYNFQWPDYVWMIDGWIPRCSMAVPIIGYLIIFNDYVAGNITFHNLIGEQASPLGLSSGSRLRLIYFGLLSLGLSNIIYRIRRPYLMRLGNNQFNFVEKGLKVFTISEYIQFHGDIRQHGHYTMYGKYYDSEWDGFLAAARGVEGRSDRPSVPGDWVGAKLRYEHLLRSILTETFFSRVIKRRISLMICIILRFLGIRCYSFQVLICLLKCYFPRYTCVSF